MYLKYLKTIIFLFIIMSFLASVYPSAYAQGPSGLSYKIKKEGVFLSWQPAPGAVRGYFVKKSENGGVFKIIGFAGDDTVYTDSDVQKGKFYSYLVAAADSKNKEIGSSNVIGVNMAGEPSKPKEEPPHKVGSSRPKSYTAPETEKPSKPKKEELSEDEPADEPRLEYKKPAEEEQPKPKKIRKALETPAIPDNVKISSSENSIMLQWSPARGATGYFIYRSLSGRNDDFLLIKKINSGVTFEDQLVKAGKTYYYYVVAFAKNDMDDSVKSEHSDIVSASLE
ncbi:MAG: hypothetical protein QMC67_16210 [Candidatus Wallbacteria bacterium]